MIQIGNATYDATKAADYHYGGFPPRDIDLNEILFPLTNALQQLTRYDEKLGQMQNSELLLAPLRQRDAVVSSRMEGTISTLDDVLRVEANAPDPATQIGPNTALEVALYARALMQSEQMMARGYAMLEHVIRSAHETLLSFGRGASKNPGKYKQEQNYIGDESQRLVYFIPASPEHLPHGMAALIDYLANAETHPLIKIATAHAEFEALHPFDDGNGRVGRMIIPLLLWEHGLLSAPHFFVSDYFERNKNEYIERLRAVSLSDSWTSWTKFFLVGLAAQADRNIRKLNEIQSLYAEMRERFRETLRSQYFQVALDYVFANPYFWNNRFTSEADGPKTTLANFTPRLVEAGLLRVTIPPSGRASGLYAFQPLLDVLNRDD